VATHGDTAPAGTAPSASGLDGSLHAFRVIVAYSPDPAVLGLPRVIGGEALVIGREAAGLSIPDPTASREHLALDTDGVRVRLRDLKSRNGVFVMGRRVETAELGHGDVFRVGDHCFVLQALTATDVEQLLVPTDRKSVLLGESVAMRALRAAVERAAPGSAPVLVLGESGSGKELVAAELHRQSGRRGAFVPVNCAAIPDELAESELFGHARGAFSGALSASDGLFGAADGGTLLLDEIGETSAATQARLLRALADGEVRRVGEQQAKKRDVRVLAATNVDLELAVQAGRFRGDLLARLRGHVIHVPPLRARREDVIPLAVAYATRPAPDQLPNAASIASSLTPDAAEALLVHSYPWNVRELVQAMRAVPSGIERIKLGHLPKSMHGSLGGRVSAAPSPAPTLAILEVRPDATPTEAELRTVLAHFAGNVSRVADFFGKERKQVYRWAERHGIDLEGARESE
jgi:DNA-binding NtrC family response regulator